jgi:hypothetical protein
LCAHSAGVGTAPRRAHWGRRNSCIGAADLPRPDFFSADGARAHYPHTDFSSSNFDTSYWGRSRDGCSSASLASDSPIPAGVRDLRISVYWWTNLGMELLLVGDL